MSFSFQDRTRLKPSLQSRDVEHWVQDLGLDLVNRKLSVAMLLEPLSLLGSQLAGLYQLLLQLMALMLQLQLHIPWHSLLLNSKPSAKRLRFQLE